MNIEYLKQLVNEYSKIDPENEVLIQENIQKRLEIMSISLDETIDYLNTCNENELLMATEVLEDLSAFFKSKELITCVKQNILRCINEDIKNDLKMTLEYMEKHI